MFLRVRSARLYVVMSHSLPPEFIRHTICMAVSLGSLFTHTTYSYDGSATCKTSQKHNREKMSLCGAAVHTCMKVLVVVCDVAGWRIKGPPPPPEESGRGVFVSPNISRSMYSRCPCVACTLEILKCGQHKCVCQSACHIRGVE